MHSQKHRSVKSLLQQKPSQYKSRFNFNKASSFLFPNGSMQRDANVLGSAAVKKNLTTFFVNAPKKNQSSDFQAYFSKVVKKKPFYTNCESDYHTTKTNVSHFLNNVNDSESSYTQDFYDRAPHFRLPSLEHLDDMSNQHDIKKSFKPDGIKITDAYQESHAHKKTLHDDVKGTPNTSLMESPRQNEKHFMDLNANKFFSPPIDPLSSLALPKESNSSEMKSNPASTPSNDNESHLSQINETEAYHTKLIDPQTHFVHRFNSIDDASQKEQNTITDKMNFSEKEPHSLPFAQKFSKQTTLSINSCHNIYTSQIRPFHSYAFDESSFSSIDQFRLPRKGLKTSLMSQSSESSSCDLIKNYPYTKFLLEDLHNYTATLDWHHVYLYLSSKRGLEKNTA